MIALTSWIILADWICWSHCGGWRSVECYVGLCYLSDCHLSAITNFDALTIMVIDDQIFKTGNKLFQLKQYLIHFMFRKSKIVHQTKSRSWKISLLFNKRCSHSFDPILEIIFITEPISIIIPNKKRVLKRHSCRLQQHIERILRISQILRGHSLPYNSIKYRFLHIGKHNRQSLNKYNWIAGIFHGVPISQ